MTRCQCELIAGGWIGDDNPQNFSIHCYDEHKERTHYFHFRGIGKYNRENTKALLSLCELINQLSTENRQSKYDKDIQNGFNVLSGIMGNDVANCEYCEEGLLHEGFALFCDRCGHKHEYPINFESRIENNRYRKRMGYEVLEDDG